MSEAVTVAAEEPAVSEAFSADETAILTPEAPEPAQAAEPEPVAEAPKPEPEAPKQVPLAALMEERRARKEAEDREKRLMAMVETVNRRLAAETPVPAAPQLPSLDADPVGHFAAKTETIDQRLQRFEQAEAMKHAEVTFQQEYAAKAHEFKAITPDFQAAYDFAISKITELAPLAGTTPRDIEVQIAVNAMRAGKNPGEAIYEAAKRFGYTGQAPAAAPAVDRMAALERGAAAARTPSAAAGRPTGGGLTFEQLANMSDDEFARVPADVRDRLFAG